MPVKALITNISRGSLHDGPGVRTVVYFKGCGLRCKWCHNPETLSLKKQISYIKSKCIHCGKCIKKCPEHHIIQNDDMVFLREGCTACGECAKVCPSLALELCGEEKNIEEVFGEIKKDLHYYFMSGGGVTFSGGECLLQADFVMQIAGKCKEDKINTAIESSLFVPYENVKKVIPYIDLFFVDLKIPDFEKHRRYTGKDNRLIIDNIVRLSKEHNNIILRIPIIPGVNDSKDDITGLAEIIKTFGCGVKKVELLKYNTLAEEKYVAVGKEYTKFAQNAQSDNEMQVLCDMLEKESNIECYFV